MKDLIHNTMVYMYKQRNMRWCILLEMGTNLSFETWCKEQEETKLIKGLQEELDKL